MNTGGQLSVCGQRKEDGGSGDLLTGGPGTLGGTYFLQGGFYTEVQEL